MVRHQPYHNRPSLPPTIDFLGIRVQRFRLFSEDLVPTLKSTEDPNHVGAMPFPQRPAIHQGPPGS